MSAEDGGAVGASDAGAGAGIPRPDVGPSRQTAGGSIATGTPDARSIVLEGRKGDVDAKVTSFFWQNDRR